MGAAGSEPTHASLPTMVRERVSVVRVFTLLSFAAAAMAIGGAFAVSFTDSDEKGGGGPGPTPSANLVGYYYRSSWNQTPADSPSLVPTTAFYVEPGSTTNGLQAEYFGNPDLSGPPRSTTTDPMIDWFPPAGGLNRYCFQCLGTPEQLSPNPLRERAGSATNASVRWTGEIALPTGETTFYVIADDGFRLFLDGQLLIDLWPIGVPSPGLRLITHQVTTNRTAAGRVPIRVDYSQRFDFAGIQLGWKPGRGGYYWTEIGPSAAIPITPGDASTPNLSPLFGSPFVGGGETNVDYPVYNARLQQITGAASGNQTAVDYYVWILAERSGTYGFHVTSSDGFGFWHRGSGAALADWSDRSAPQEFSTTMSLTPGWHAFGLRYYQNAGPATLRLGWTTPSGAKVYPIPPTHITATPPAFCPDGSPLNACSVSTPGQFCTWWGHLEPGPNC